MALLEVGAGEGSLARWLSARVEPHGSVLATDLDPSLTDGRGDIEVRRHDVVHDAALERNFLAPTPILWSVIGRRAATSHEEREVRG